MYLVRHPPTKLNNPSNERIRGMLDIPPTNEGKVEAHQTTDWFKDKIIRTVYTSPLQRASYQAASIARSKGIKMKPDKGLLPWDLGDLQGKPVAEVKDRINYFVDHPTETVPGGEPFQSFLDRFQTFHEAHKDEPDSVAVTHLRNILTARALESGKFDRNRMDDFKLIDKVRISRSDSNKFEPLLRKTEGKAKGGS